MSEITNDLTIKVVLLGQSMVGKTCIVGREMDNAFSEDQMPTVGVGFVNKNFEVEDHRIRLQIWDTAGEERFKSVAPMYYRDCHAAVLVYAINDEATFEQVEMWIKELQKHMENMPLLYIVGNKADLVEEKKVLPDMVKALCEKYSAEPVETSAKNGTGINELFKLIVNQAYQTHRTKNTEPALAPKEPESSCC